MTAVLPRLACTTSGIALTTVGCLALERHLRNGKKLLSLAAGTAAILVRRIAEARNGPRQIY
jgi:hypothetical protein